MHIDLTSDPAFAEAVKTGMREAMLNPEFRRALVADMATEFVWLTCKQVAEMCGGRTEETVRRWAKRNGIEVTGTFGPREPLYSLRSVQHALQTGVIREKKAPRVPGVRAPAQVGSNGHRTGDAPLRSVGRLKAESPR